MIVALVNQSPCAGRTTLAVHLAGELALQGNAVALLDTDWRSGALKWADARRRNTLPTLFHTVGMSSPRLRYGVWSLHARFDHVIIDTPATSAAALRAALLVADTVLLPSRPERPALERCAATMRLVAAALAIEPAMSAAVVPTRAPESVTVEPGATVTVRGLRLPMAVSVLHERMIFAMSRGTGLLVSEIERAGPAQRDVRRLVGEVFGSRPTAGEGAVRRMA